MCRHPAPDTAGHPPPQLLLLPAIFSLQTKTARAVAKTTFRERMKMKHSIMRMEAAPVRDPAANAGAGTLYMVVEEVWCLAGGGGGSTLDTVATTDTAMLRGPALAASLAAAPRTRNTQPSHQDTLVTHGRALTPASSQQGGWRQNLYLYYVILVDNQRGSDLKCGFPLHSDYFGSKEI